MERADDAILLYLNYDAKNEDLEREFTNLAPGPSPQGPARSMDHRMLGLGSQILRSLGVRKMNVHMVQTMPLRGLSGFGLEVVNTTSIRSSQSTTREEAQATH